MPRPPSHAVAMGDTELRQRLASGHHGDDEEGSGHLVPDTSIKANKHTHTYNIYHYHRL